MRVIPTVVKHTNLHIFVTISQTSQSSEYQRHGPAYQPFRFICPDLQFHKSCQLLATANQCQGNSQVPFRGQSHACHLMSENRVNGIETNYCSCVLGNTIPDMVRKATIRIDKRRQYERQCLKTLLLNVTTYCLKVT